MHEATEYLRDQVIENIRLYQSGRITTDTLATRITHLNFDGRLTDEVRADDPELALIIEDYAPYLEVDPESYVDYLERIVTYASPDSGCRPFGRI
ncbi:MULTISPECIES: hypothetical protein [Mycobacteroides]|uniref:hypothetical protein n=1 Tax=Mycobacteroides TaxID=670516 RepID=UPI000993AF46|nr:MULTISPECIES: hypothetical protein [Mycobacteroides]AWG70738.1 hypothetical protein DDT49_19745 [Mycobacteroides abscessus]PVB05518.1 hypothetical protein DDJ51_00120 [Mycobacteroides abscessus]PVB30180.1 hypothetical protein DDJ92_12210 [Mycobacteroides abscessus]SKK72037.1 Uncharacterised protein [Mycobacteroides abscessus subsp. massiliense]SKL19231.1 Uncharacterised protein [Mycobacteroides abscessus subsp. massiliense]